jgi:hypothetical protein
MEIEPIKVKVEDKEIEVVPLEKVKELETVLTGKLAGIEAELAKERSKEKNFNQLRKARLSDLSTEEQSKLSEREKMLMESQEAYEKEMQSFKDQQTKFMESQKATYKNRAYRDFGVDSEDDRKRVEANYNRLKDPDDTEEEVMRKVQLAHEITFGRRGSGSDNLNQVARFGGSGGMRAKDVPFHQTEAGKSAAKLLGLKTE